MKDEASQEVSEAIKRLLSSKGAASHKSARKPQARSSLIVAKEQIRTIGGDPSAAAKLERYQVLNRPLPLAPAPSLKGLGALREQMPKAAPLIDQLVLDVRFSSQGRQKLVPAQHILLWGATGAGKTWFAKRLLGALSSQWISYAAGGLSSALDLTGQVAAFRDSDASLPARAMMRTGVANPGILCDEIDKIGSSDWNGNPHLALLAFTERENSEKFYDPFLQVHVDCSRVHWVFTANDVDKLPSPLLSRLRMFEVERPGEEALNAILSGFARDLAAEFGLKVRQLPPIDDLLRLKMARRLKAGDDLRKIRAQFNQEIKQRAVAERFTEATDMSTGLPVASCGLWSVGS